MKNNRYQNIFDYDWDTPGTTQAVIRPEDARIILENHNKGNRFLRSTGAKYIAKQILNNEWCENHPQPICFSREDRLIDGQHRMAGIALAEKPVVASVSFGVDPKLVKYIDTGISRTLGDRVQFVENPKHNAIIASWLSKMAGRKTSSRLTPEESMALFHRYKNALTELAPLRRPMRGIGNAVVGSVVVMYYSRYGSIAKDFYEALYERDSDVQQARYLRDWILSSDRRIDNGLARYIVAACIAHAEGRPIRVLRACDWR